jgi:hypothetical protein
LGEHYGIKYRGRPRYFHRGNNNLGGKVGKMEIPTFDGSTNDSAREWVQKLDAYLRLNPMMEMDAIKFSTLYFEGKSHEWWYHGMTTLGHAYITSYANFTQRLIDKFDQGDLVLHLCELTQLKKTSTTEVFIEEIQRLAVMVPDVSESRLMMLFFEILIEPLCGWVKDFNPNTLQDAIWRTRDL